MQFLEKYQNNYVWGQFNPAVDNTYDLGNTSKGWKDLFLKGRLYDNNNSGGSAGQVLITDGGGTLSWSTLSTGTPGGSTTQVQFNDAGAFGGDAGLTYDKTNDILTVTGNYEGDINGAVLQKVYNNTAGTLSKGEVVYLPGGNNGDNPYADLARADSIVTMPALGIVRNDITPTSLGEVVTSGELTGLGSLLSRWMVDFKTLSQQVKLIQYRL